MFQESQNVAEEKRLEERMGQMRINPDLVTVAEFARQIRLSKQRLYQLWDAGKGPTRIERAGLAADQPRYLIPLEEGLRWHEERR